MKLKLMAFSVLGALSLNVFADNGVEQRVVEQLRSVFPKLTVEQIKESHIQGLYEVMLGAEVLYASADGRYIVQGDMIDLKNRRNLSEQQRSKARVKILRDIPKNEIVAFPPAKTKHSVYVFTDISCGYCRRLHRDVEALNQGGIAVNYLAFPRQGAGSANFRDMESVWCAADRTQAMTDAKFGKGVKSAKCANPVAKHFELGQVIGVRGTPAIYLENGQQVGGYLPPEELIKAVYGTN